MNMDKFEKKIEKKYGVKSEVLKDLSIRKIKNLKNINTTKLKEQQKFKFIRKPIATIIKGASIGTGVAGCINTIFPNLIPVIGTYVVTSSKIPNKYKLTILTTLASLPVDLSQGYIILGVGATIGAVLYSGYSLVKTSTKNLKIISDRSKAKKINRF